MTQYRIIHCENSLELVKLVEEHISSGWTPLGGVGFSGWWYQSLTK